MTTANVAVIGAGLSGLTCARRLVAAGRRVEVFDKARGPGGRLATRRSAPWQWDHGAQYFTVRDPRFLEQVTAWRSSGLVEPWTGRLIALSNGETTELAGTTERFVAVPRMSAVTRRLSQDLSVSLDTRVQDLHGGPGEWVPKSEDGRDLGRFDRVVVSTPAPQAVPLLSASPRLAEAAASVRFAPCWAVLAALPRALDVDWDGAFVSDSPLSWIARDGSKPGRPADDTWLLHGSPEWSEQHLELEPSAALPRLLEAFAASAGVEIPSPSTATAHRWRYALPQTPLEERFLFDSDSGLAACGDWCGGPRVEGAFLSGLAVAEQLLAED